LNCAEQVCIKGDQDKLIRIKLRLEEVTKQYNEAQNAMNSGHAGADRWYEYHKNTMHRLQQLISILENPQVQEGAQIKLRNDKAFSP
jgi:malonyl CoA-acyl carrier protein transacylase